MKPPSKPIVARWRRRLRRAALVAASAVAGYFVLCTGLLVVYRWVDPPFTAVQAQRRLESWFREGPYRKRQRFVPLEQISIHLRHAVVAAEDTRFYHHAGVDWKAVGEAMEDNRHRDRRRGGSTLSQQLAKNLFLTTHSNWARKAAEVPLAYLTDRILGKRRVLEIYLNVVEWGPRGVFGAEAAARHHFGVSARHLPRRRAARLAACLPAPHTREPPEMDRYADVILRRMSLLGW